MEHVITLVLLFGTNTYLAMGTTETIEDCHKARDYILENHSTELYEGKTLSAVSCVDNIKITGTSI